MSFSMDADAICDPFRRVHIFRHGWGFCVCGQEEWSDPPVADLVTRERLGRAEKALTDPLPAGNPLWKPWAMDLADDLRATVFERDEERKMANDMFLDAQSESRRAETLERERDVALDRITVLEAERDEARRELDETVEAYHARLREKSAAEAERDRLIAERQRLTDEIDKGVRALWDEKNKFMEALEVEMAEKKALIAERERLRDEIDADCIRIVAAEAERDEAQARLSSIGGYEGYDDALERLRKQRNQLLIGSLETTVALLDAEVIFPADFSPELRRRLVRALKGDME